jgi:hypothetical protein
MTAAGDRWVVHWTIHRPRSQAAGAQRVHAFPRGTRAQLIGDLPPLAAGGVGIVLGEGGADEREAESDVLAYMSFPPAHRPKLHSTKWTVQRARYMTLETMAGLRDDPFVKLPAVAA